MEDDTVRWKETEMRALWRHVNRFQGRAYTNIIKSTHPKIIFALNKFCMETQDCTVFFSTAYCHPRETLQPTKPALCARCRFSWYCAVLTHISCCLTSKGKQVFGTGVNICRITYCCLKTMLAWQYPVICSSPSPTLSLLLLVPSWETWDMK